jgi:hypothetical protein
VINLPEKEEARIDKTTLTFEVAGVKDARDNIGDDIIWTAYANRNTLKWDTEQVDITMEQSETKSFTAIIANLGGSSVNYLIEDIPVWLNLSATSGTLLPLASRTLTFTVAPGTNIGSYEASITLTSISSLREVLPVTLKVTGERPDWAVNPSEFEFTMNIIGQVKIDGAVQEDEDDILGAFIGNVCVGVASPIYVKEQNACYVFDALWGNTEHRNQPITFKLWDASTGRIYPKVIPSTGGGVIKFTASGNLGSINSPVSLEAVNIVEQPIDIATGWTWASSNLTTTSPDLSIFTQMKNSLSTDGIIIKGRLLYVQNPGWSGALTDVTPENMYMIKTSQSQKMILQGVYANPLTTDIAIVKGWNWIGFTPSVSMSVKDALAGINAQPDDMIKGQDGFSIFMNSGAWAGSLTNMQPGKGYMYSSNGALPKTFYYPASVLRSVQLRSNENRQTPKWSVDYYRFPTSMTITAIALNNDVVMQSELVEIGAFSGDECRGSVLLQYVEGLENPYLGFLMVFGDPGDEITYKIYDHATQTEYEATGPTNSFLNDEIYGNPAAPEKITANSTTGNDNLTNGLVIYPNPVKDKLYIRYNDSQLDALEIFDISGRLIVKEENFTEKSIDVSKLEKGIYLLHVTVNGKLSVHKFIKQ